MLLEEQDRQADAITEETCAEVKEAMKKPLPLFMTPLLISWHWVNMLHGIARCYDASFNESVVRDMLRNKRVVMAYLAAYGGLISLAQQAQQEFQIGNITSEVSAGLTRSLAMIYRQCWREGRNPTVEEVVKALIQFRPPPSPFP